jgi:putative YhbY family RNA-binding protein
MNTGAINELTAAERRALRARAHHLRPVVMIGDAGLTPEVTREIDVNLKSHELIKIRAMAEGRDARDALAAAICEATGAQAVQHIGKILVVYRPKPPEERKPAKQRAHRKPRRRTKRSYQNM